MLCEMKKSRVYYELFKDTVPELKDAFSQVKDEFEEHLTAINENTNEIQATHECFAHLEEKITKVEEKLEKISLFLQSAGFEAEEQPEFSPIKLSKREQEVFLVLYTQEEVKGPLSYLDVAHYTGIPEDIIASYIANMIAKGVPLRKRYINNQARFSLHPHFKAVQAKENILGIEQQMLSV